jgi:hypothetical protein
MKKRTTVVLTMGSKEISVIGTIVGIRTPNRSLNLPDPCTFSSVPKFFSDIDHIFSKKKR